MGAFLLLVAALALPAVPAAAGEWPSDDPFAPAERPAVDAAERERLLRGDVLVRELRPTGGTGIGLLTMAWVDGDVETVWRVMQDCDEQDEFLPRVIHAEVRDRAGDSHVCELHVDMPFPLDDVETTSRHRVRRLPDGGHQRRWEVFPDDPYYERNRGSWTVHPFGEGALVVTRMDLLPHAPIPNWVLHAAQTRQAPETFAAIRERVRRTSSPSLNVPRSAESGARPSRERPPGSPP